MSYFKDLSLYEYSGRFPWCGGEVRNVGWLGGGRSYPHGAVDLELTAKLLALCKWPVNQFFGRHSCDFCQEYPVRIADQEGEFRFGDGEIRVPRNDSKVVYAAPNLIYHYVTAHQYLPPAEFVDSLRVLTLRSPAMFWILEKIEFFQHDPVSILNLSKFLERIAHMKRSALPPEVKNRILEVANELEIAGNTLGPDARLRAENIVDSLKSLLTGI